MKREAVIVIGIVLIGLLVIGGIFYSSKFKNSPEENSLIVQPEENNILNKSIEELETIPLKEEFKIFQPNLTYEGFYNGPLYATSEQIGDGYDIDKYMSNLDRNGVNFFIGMFPILGKQSESNLIINSDLGYVLNNVKKYPYRVVPFFNPGYGGKEIENDKIYGAELTSLYVNTLSSSKSIAGNNLIKGMGEIETQEWNIAHDDQKVLQLIDVASSNNINFMFHPVASKINDVETLIEKYPNTNFLIHLYRADLDKKRTEWIGLIKTHDNLYFSIDAAHIIHDNGNDLLYDYYDDYGDNAAPKFISFVNSNYNRILNDAVSDYKPLVQAVPDKVMWGTEAGPEYAFEPKVYDLIIKMSREFISKVADSPEEQEALGYKNALRVFGQGAVLEKEIDVRDTSSWPFCTEDQMGLCENEICGVSETDDDLSPEEEACFNECLFKEECIDPLA